jgi:hypothetical protein
MVYQELIKKKFLQVEFGHRVGTPALGIVGIVADTGVPSVGDRDGLSDMGAESTGCREWTSVLNTSRPRITARSIVKMLKIFHPFPPT